ncbi:hypothetical protein L207DRAFT_634679 [Hyaloscypha variabilis F]|uniref:CHAT domain-containing protein n=1 Tax=Hyaloscypha variabilis (strain UAMH 11265 / GT02V1 / F) TaxID=1149755 RepID=A0A2J6RJG1_HYAVF|nr:hypothetical protein L207DRAFT_634679 [Hyaloscypha variabilis F]
MEDVANTQTYHLRILAKPSKAETPGWEVSVYLGGACFAKSLTLSDPFTKVDEDECRWYLEDYLTKTPFEKSRADIAAESLNSYADSLFDQLRLSRVWRRLAGPRSPKNKFLEIDIIEDTEDLNAVSFDTVHRLHWEVLEYPRLWKNINLKTAVRRIIPQKETSTLSIKRVESWSRGVPAVNILLVVSRRLIRGGAEEVDPNQVLKSMQTLKRDLETRSALFRLNIEVVRPGSFKALQKHLDERSRRRYNGDIHIVHFDVHGRVGLRSEKGQEKATKTAFLYFQSTRDDARGTLAPTRAGAVADLLRKHNIRIVVLNACESAKATNKGDEANIARTFTKAGVQNVLAMAYKTLGPTCTTFMRCFYESLIAGGNPFSIAVRDAREHLRSAPNRDARFALNRQLEDWIIPVVYASGKDVELRISAFPNNNLELEGSTPHINESKPTTSNPQPVLVGRGFDVLRFETMFLASKITGLCGPAGVGKTAFVQHLIQSWKDTGLYDNVLYLDCALVQMDQIDTSVFFQHLLGRGKSNSLVPELTGPKVAEYHSAIAALGDNIQVVILDNLEVTHSSVKGMEEHGRWPETTRAALMPLINDIVRNKPVEEEEGVSFILIGRSDDDKWWEGNFPDLPAFPRYRLNGLSLPDAIGFAHDLLGKHGLDRSQWGHTDEDVLSQILNILQCNPLAIETVLENTASQKQPWKELFEKILFHQYFYLESVASDARSFLIRDMAYPSISGHRKIQYARVFSALALYWHQGPSRDNFKMFILEDEDIASALDFGIDRGFFSLDGRGFVENIHPLFTLMGRNIFGNISYGSNPFASVFGTALEWTLNANDDSENHVTTPWFIGNFFLGVDSRDLGTFMKKAGMAGKFNEFEKDLRPAFYNILTCLRLCSVGKTPISIDAWPYALQMYGHCSMWFLSADEIALMVKHCEIVLRRFILRRPKVFETRIIGTMISIGNTLTIAHLTQSTLPTKRAKDISDLTFKLIDCTDEGMRKDKGISEVIAMAMLKRELAEFAVGSKTIVETEALRNSIDKNVTDEELAGINWKDLKPDLPDPQHRGKVLEDFVRGVNSNAKYLEMRKNELQGLDPAEIGFAMNRFVQSSNIDWGAYTASAGNLDRTARRAELEKSLDVRNRTEAINNYKALLSQALQGFDLEEALEIFNSLIEIYRTDEDVFAEELKLVLDDQKRYQSLYHMFKLCSSEAGADEIPDTSQRNLEEIKQLEFTYTEKTEKGFMDKLYESAKSQKPGSTAKSRVQRPRKLYKEVMDGWRRRAENPEEIATLRELARLFEDLWYQHEQALEASDFDKALQIFDKLIEVDARELFIGIPFSSIPEYRQKLVYFRDYMGFLQKAHQAAKEDRQADAIKILKFLIQEYSNQSPGIPDSLLQMARENLQGQLWTQGFNEWWTAFIAEDLSQALKAICYLRQVETSISSSSPMTAIVKNVSFPAHEYTHWNYMRTLHRHFHATSRPSLALKVVSYILKLYDFPGNVELLPWLEREDLKKERDFERLYEALVRWNKLFAGS